jgi:GLPGLI family protein
LQRLEIGKNISKYYSYFRFNSDSLITVWHKAHSKTESFPGRLGAIGKKDSWDEYIFSEYFKDYDKNSLTHYIHKPDGPINPYQYSENMPMQTWEIAEDTLIVAEYLCQKATCTFRGRNFTAWFTMDIPVQNGPWKFSGLPGLILKVYDNDRLYEFECIKVENFKKKYPIKIHDYKNYEKIDRQKLQKNIKRLYDDYLTIIGVSKPTKPWQKIPYNPLELE